MWTLTVRQPKAHLLVRNELRYLVRPSDTTWRERIAIHAHGETEAVKTFFAELRRRAGLRRMAKRLDLTSFEAIAALPRSAIVGTVKVARVIRGSDLRRTRAALGPVKPNEYVWEFEDPVCFKPLKGVTGKPNLWRLDVHRACDVMTAEARWRDQPYVRLPSEPWKTDDEADERHRRDPINWHLKVWWKELKLRRLIRGYFDTHQQRGRGTRKEVHIDRRVDALREMFKGVEWVSLEEFERTLRFNIGGEGEYVIGPSDWRQFDDSDLEPDDWSARDEMRELSNYMDLGNGIGQKVVGSDDRIRWPRPTRAWEEMVVRLGASDEDVHIERL